MKKTVLSILMGITLAGCYYDKADVINPNAAYITCDTTNVTYSGTIAPILSNNNCLGCHGSSAITQLDTYSAVKSAATSGKLLPAVNWSNTGNYIPMPSGGSKISDCNINKIAAWINQGEKN